MNNDSSFFVQGYNTWPRYSRDLCIVWTQQAFVLLSSSLDRGKGLSLRVGFPILGHAGLSVLRERSRERRRRSQKCSSYYLSGLEPRDAALSFLHYEAVSRGRSEKPGPVDTMLSPLVTINFVKLEWINLNAGKSWAKNLWKRN